MKIEKKKITGIKSISLAAKSALAATLGMFGALTLNACDDSTSASDNNSNQTTGPESSDANAPASSTDEATPASSESVSDATSQEKAPASSSQEQASETSSQQQSQASSSSKVVDIPLSHESISSSVMEALSSALESSSSAAEPASSESVPASSASQPTEQELKDACQGSPGGTSVDIGGQMYLCPNSDGGVTFSMISTFERTDAEV